MSKKIYVLILILASTTMMFAQKGKDGARTHSSNTTLIPNRYATLAATANAGATSITVDNISKLAGSYSFTNSANYFASSNLASGDLVMVIQMQGADINTTNTSAYGTVTNLKSVGKYELLEVSSVSGNTIFFNCTGSSGLANTYTVGSRNRAQVVRIPRFTTLTVNNNRRLTGMPWNGAEGGIVAIEANTSMTLNGRISADTLGFRGGDDITPDYSSDPGIPAITDYVSTNQYDNAQKGEGIAGNVTDYASLGGAYGRGAPANGGGGGNGHNAGGGGGSNAGTTTGYRGSGEPDVSNSSWISAWNRDVQIAPSGSIVNSPGGGRGGYTFASSNANALNDGPGSSAWGGNNRGNVGGWGGRPLDNSNRDRLFLGGGGGAGEGNNYAHGQGGKGAGIVFLLSHGTITGSNDSITAIGRAGYSTSSGGNDAPGGGGAGGTIVVLARTSISNIRARAHGGVGGNQNMICCGDETEGPGGGGSGGYIATNQSSGVSAVASGGLNGTTNSTGITEFTPNGATKGSAGVFSNAWAYQDPSGNDLSITQVFSGSTAVCQNTPITIQITVTNNGSSSSSGIIVGDTLPSSYLFLSARTTNGSYDTINDRWVLSSPLAAGASATLFLDVVVTATTTPSNTVRIVACTPADCITSNNVATLSSGLTITSAPTTSAAGADQTRCNGSTSFTLAANAPSVGTGIWSLVSGSATITTPSSRTSTVTVTASETAILRWTISNSCGFSLDEMTITHSSAVTANAGPDQANCSGVSTFNLAGNVPAAGSGVWTTVSGTATVSNSSNPLSTVSISTPSVTLRWTITNGSCSAFDDVLLRNLTGTAPTTANAGEDISLCCLSNSALSANVAAVGSGTWSVISGPNTPTFSSTSSPTATISGLQNGTYILRWTITNGSCSSSDDLELNINCNSGNNNKGKDGGLTVTGTQRIYNRYSNLTTSVSAGSRTLTATTVNTLKGSYISSGMVNGFANDALGPGDLVMIIQMQGADIDTTNTSSYGSVTSYGNTGKYEIFEVGDVTGNVITLSSPAGLMNSYSTGYRNRTQLVRIPRWSSLTVNSGSSISAKPWDGVNGGIVAIEVSGVSTINGNIDVTGDGFRGGSEDNTVTLLNDNFFVTSTTRGGSKGEGIAGTPSDYASYLRGTRGKGAPANGGGGGVSVNSGGGGGANAAASGTYTGNGDPANSSSWDLAWNLESSGFASSTSTGGGRGGYSYSLVDANATTSGPGSVSSWGGSGRLNTGGLGGRPLDYASNTRLFMGGGGGSGEGDNSSYGNGGNGGGIIYFLAHGALSGSGTTFIADGNSGENTMNANRDGAGGGGGGGAVYLNAKSTVTGVTISAKGGAGGNQLSPLVPANSEAQGPGGGGGGGYVLTTQSITSNVTAGSNGITNVSSLSEFTPNGATAGSAGLTQTTTFRDNFSTIVDLKIKLNTTAPPNVCPADTVRFRIVLNNANTTCTKSTGVQVKTDLASQLDFISALPSNGTYNAGTGIWTVSSPISANDSAILSMVTLTNASPVDSSKSFITTIIETDPISENDTAKNAGFVGVGCTPLPVELLSFTAQPIDNQYAKLEWITTLEINNDHFDIERSADGSNFTKIGETKGMGNTTEMTTYTYIDSTPSVGVNYYKLRQVDYDGKFEYTDIRSVVITKSSPTAFMYPNPCSDFTYVDLRGFDLTQNVKFYLTNSVGLMVRTADVKGGDIYTLPVSVLAEGSYILNIVSEQYEQSFKLLIQK